MSCDEVPCVLGRRRSIDAPRALFARARTEDSRARSLVLVSEETGLAVFFLFPVHPALPRATGTDLITRLRNAPFCQGREWPGGYCVIRIVIFEVVDRTELEVRR